MDFGKVEIIMDLDFDEYLKLPRMSSSALKSFIESPAFYQFRKTSPFKSTPAMELGTMVHEWILENTTFAKRYYSMPEIVKPDIIKPIKPKILKPKKPLKKDEEWVHAKYLVDLGEYEEIMSEHKGKVEKYEKIMTDHKNLIESYHVAANGRIIMPEEVVNKYTTLKPRFDTVNEVTVLFDMCGVPCKARFDMLHRNPELPMGVEDLKTIRDITKIDRDFANLKYYIQAGFYTMAYKAAYGEWPEFFKFNFVNTGEFLQQITCETSHDYIEYGRMIVLEQMEYFKECLEKDNWPGLTGYTIERPNWI
tara:strand:+ start:2965 stop:3885 length:921 start_codon:yes stop_codon:yes gene_type:complete